MSIQKYDGKIVEIRLQGGSLQEAGKLNVHVIARSSFTPT